MLKVDRISKELNEATNEDDYGRAVRKAKRLKGKDQLLVLDALFAAATRLGLADSPRYPRVPVLCRPTETRTIHTRHGDVLVETV